MAYGIVNTPGGAGNSSGSSGDTKVNVTLAAASKAYLLGTTTVPTASPAAVTAVADTGVYLDTAAGKLTAGSFSGSGAALTSLNASSLSSGTVPVARLPVATTSAAGAMSAEDKKKLDDLSSGGSGYTHPTYTARTGVPTTNQTPGFGGTFTVTQPVSDGTGHITGMNSRTVTIPNAAATENASGLMSYSDKAKLDGIASGATKTTVDSALSTTSTNPVQNKVVKNALNEKLSLTGGTMTGNIQYNMYDCTAVPLCVYGGNENGMGVRIGAGGCTIIGGGESAVTIQEDYPATTDRMVVAGDWDIEFVAGCDSTLTDDRYPAKAAYTSYGNFRPDENLIGGLGTTGNRWYALYAGKLVVNSYGSAFPSSPDTGELFFKI